MQVPVSKVPKQRGRPDGPSPAREAELSLAEARNQMFQGVSISDMVVIFRLDKRTIQTRIADVQPCGKRRNFPIWQIRDVAPYLVRPAGDIEEHIRRMRPNDLPSLLSKEFWNGQRSKLRYLEETGQLWRTDKVVEALSRVMKTVRMNLLLLPDALERKTALTDKQRDEVRQAIDGTLEELRDALTSEFEDDEEGPGIDAIDEGSSEHEFSGAADAFEDEDEEDDDEWNVPTELDTGDL